MLLDTPKLFNIFKPKQILKQTKNIEQLKIGFVKKKQELTINKNMIRLDLWIIDGNCDVMQ